MAKNVLIAATNYGVWAEELQAPWDILNGAGHNVTLTTNQGKKPLMLEVSVDPTFVDPIQNYPTNPAEVCERAKELQRGEEWAHPVKFADAKMADYDALVLTGGLGAMLDMANNAALHKLLLDAFHTDKLIGALCYSVATLVFARDPKNDYKSIIYGKKITAHPRAWDFDFDLTYGLLEPTPDNAGTDVVTPGFLYPLEDLVRDAVGPSGECIAVAAANRENPRVEFDWPFVSGTSVESSIAYGEKVAEVLATR